LSPFSAASPSLLNPARLQAPACALLLALLLGTGGIAAAQAGSAADPGAEAGATNPQSAPDATPVEPADARAGANAQEAAFFAENAQRPGVVRLPGGAQARQLSAGKGQAAAGAAMVVLNLSRRGLQEAATPTGGSSGLREQRYQTQTLPKPLFEALQLMHVGDRWEVYAPAQGKGARTAGDGVHHRTAGGALSRSRR